MKLEAKRFVIVGPQGSGKSILARHFARSFTSALIVDPLDEHGDLGRTRYIPKNLSYGPASQTEMDRVVKQLVMNGPYVRKVDLWMVDEANRYFPRSKPLPPRVPWLNDSIRHAGLSWGVIARRLVQLNTDLVELAHFLFIFRLTGKNDLSYADDIQHGLGDIIRELPPYHFVVRDAQGNLTKHSPVPMP